MLSSILNACPGRESVSNEADLIMRCLYPPSALGILAMRNKPAIIRAIVSVIINAINFQPRLPSVIFRPFDKLGWVVEPFDAHSDSSTAIVSVISSRRVNTPSLNIVQKLVEGVHFGARRKPMRYSQTSCARSASTREPAFFYEGDNSAMLAPPFIEGVATFASAVNFRKSGWCCGC